MTNQPQTVSQLFPSKWLRASDLGQGKIVTITGTRVELMKPFRGDEKEPKLVISFANASKELITTKSQAMALAELAHTEEFSKWPGLKVALVPAKLPTGKWTIEVKPAPQAQQQPAAQPAQIQPVDLYAPTDQAQQQPTEAAADSGEFDF